MTMLNDLRPVALGLAVIMASTPVLARNSIVPAIISSAQAEETSPRPATPPAFVVRETAPSPAPAAAPQPSPAAPPAATVSQGQGPAQTPVRAQAPGSALPMAKADEGAPPNATAVAPNTTPAPLAVPPPIPLMSPSARLSRKEVHAASLAQNWRNRQTASAEGPSGSVNFAYGASIPSVVCAPLYICSISLQPGEVVNDIKAGDSVRWLITPSIVGSGATKVTVVTVKPTDAGLRSALIISTTKRLYQIELVSTQKSWMGNVTFTYPEDAQSAWQNYQTQAKKEETDTTLPSGKNLAALDFNYAVSGNAPWKPLRVYSDGIKTFIQFPRSMLSGDAPSLVALGDDGDWFSSPTKQVVNYRVDGDTYIVDKVLRRAALLSGVGSGQEEVKITHSGGSR